MNKGILATDNVTGQGFHFYTEIQGDVEHAMTLMGYGCRDYNLSFFENRKPPMDDYSDKHRETSWPGERAKELGVVLGEIGCPRCGIVTHGALQPICGMCDGLLWTKEDLEEAIRKSETIC